MARVTAPAESIVRVHGRGLILSILEKEILLTKIKVCDDGHFVTETQDWGSYWQPLADLRNRRVDASLDALHSAWRSYIRSGFGTLLRREFCFRYFSLLDVLLSTYVETTVVSFWHHSLQAALGFESFGITTMARDADMLGAGTCTLRNPCYLLSKLKMPDMLDSSQFLPTITVANTEKPGLFYHYRQYTLSPDSPMSLLLYVAVSDAHRSASFKLINALAGGVSYAIDPWTRERAQRLSKAIVFPIIQAMKPIISGTFTLEFVDVGAGSGSLTACLCRLIQVFSASAGFNPDFRLWFVDLEPADPTRFFRAKRIRGLIDSLVFIGDDYRDWLSQEQPLPATNAIRIALVSKLFNNLSRFSFSLLLKDDFPPCSGNNALLPDPNGHLPSFCLAPDGSGEDSLIISNTRVNLKEGRTFLQVSLSEFFRGLDIILSPESSLRPPKDGLFLPIRVFNPDCLVTLDNKSVISRMVENCDYVIIEDADLRPQDLITHLTDFSLHSITVQNVTKSLRLTGNHTYVLWSKTRAEVPNLNGERIW